MPGRRSGNKGHSVADALKRKAIPLEVKLARRKKKQHENWRIRRKEELTDRITQSAPVAKKRKNTFDKGVQKGSVDKKSKINENAEKAMLTASNNTFIPQTVYIKPKKEEKEEFIDEDFENEQEQAIKIQESLNATSAYSTLLSSLANIKNSKTTKRLAEDDVTCIGEYGNEEEEYSEANEDADESEDDLDVLRAQFQLEREKWQEEDEKDIDKETREKIKEEKEKHKKEVEKLVLESDDNRIVGDEEDEKKGEAGIRHTVPVLVDEVFQTRFDKPEDI